MGPTGTAPPAATRATPASLHSRVRSTAHDAIHRWRRRRTVRRSDHQQFGRGQTYIELADIHLTPTTSAARASLALVAAGHLEGVRRLRARRDGRRGRSRAVASHTLQWYSVTRSDNQRPRGRSGLHIHGARPRIRHRRRPMSSSTASLRIRHRGKCDARRSAATPAVPGVSQMRFSNDGTDAFGPWSAYSALDDRSLPAGDGIKTV